MNLLDLQSPRLRAVAWQELPADSLAALFAPAVVRWLPDGFHGLDNDGARRAFLAALSQQAEVAALAGPGGAAAGLVILSTPDRDQSARHLGYLFAEACWGQGLATELITELQAHFRGSGVTLCGGVMAANAASARVLEKAGFQGRPRAGETVYCWRAE